MVISTHSDENGAVIFRQACRTGLDGIVSKRLTAPCRGPTNDWLKIKKPDSPAMVRERSGENTPAGWCAGYSGWAGRRCLTRGSMG